MWCDTPDDTKRRYHILAKAQNLLSWLCAERRQCEYDPVHSMEQKLTALTSNTRLDSFTPVPVISKVLVQSAVAYYIIKNLVTSDGTGRIAIIPSRYCAHTGERRPPRVRLSRANYRGVSPVVHIGTKLAMEAIK